MAKRSRNFSKVFGSGPVGFLLSLVLLSVAGWLNQAINPPPISNNQVLLDAIFSISILATLMIIGWSVRSLPREDRGNKLCTTGPFKYVRHPLYAAYLSVFSFGLAIYLNSYIYVLWAVLLHPIWHYLVRTEEQQLLAVFGQAYLEYQKTTGRFFPKLR